MAPLTSSCTTQRFRRRDSGAWTRTSAWSTPRPVGPRAPRPSRCRPSDQLDQPDLSAGWFLRTRRAARRSVRASEFEEPGARQRKADPLRPEIDEDPGVAVDLEHAAEA